MARVKYVTRTIVSTKVECTMYVPSMKKNVDVSFILPGDFSELPVPKLEREVKKKGDENGQFNVSIEGKSVKCNLACVNSTEIIEKLYHMEESKFIANADKVTDGRDAE